MSEPPSTRVLYRNGAVYSPEDPFASAILIDGGQVAWVGGEGGAGAFAEDADAVVDLAGRLLAPAFVDAHVHVTAAGLGDVGLDLRATRSRRDLLDAVRQATESRRGQGLILGHGWDDTTWAEPGPPSNTELDRAAYGGAVVLERIDVHSSVVSSAVLAGFPQLQQAEGYSPDGHLTGNAHHRLRAALYADLPAAVRLEAQRATRARAGSLGIAVLHEMGGGSVGGGVDADSLAQLCRDEPGPEILRYWAAPGDPETVDHHGAHGFGGDLFIDGSLGSGTALLREPYTDRPGTGEQFLTAAQVRDHVVACTRAGWQTGFHVIGDGAMDVVLAGLGEASQVVGQDALRALSHRLEHAEMIQAEHLPAMAALGVVASMQPGFDARWGGPGGMYDERLGSRYALLNPFAALVAAGVPLAFGSDAPVIPLGPWEAVRAAAFHHVPEHRISVRAAFAAHTRGGWRAAGLTGGVLAVGMPASFAIWDVEELVVQAPDSRVAAWSTDPRSGTPGLPDLTPGAPVPTCVRTVREGEVIFDAGRL